jgi:deoxyribonuclease-4
MYGFHIDSSIENICEQLKNANKLGCNIVQLFVFNLLKNMKEYIKFENLLKKYNMSCYVHASYTINLCKNWDEYSWWINEFIEEIKIANMIGAKGIIIHLGKKKELTIEESMNNMFSSLTYIHNKTIKYENIKILIETSSGQGSEVCYTINDLGKFYDKINKNKYLKNRFGICLDTCHIFVSGHDIRENIMINKFLKTFDKIIGIDNIKLVHLNDSKKDIGSKIDRHENIGYGCIGKKNLIKIAKHFYDNDIPIILETPNIKLKNDIIILKKIFK